MSGYHDPLDTFNPKEKPTASQSSMNWYSRDLEVEDWGEKKNKYTDEELAQHRAEWRAIKKANDEKRLKEQNLSSQTENNTENGKCAIVDRRLLEKLVISTAILICLTWCICTWIGSCSGRYTAMANGQILDKKTGTIFYPNSPKIQEFGKRPKWIK